MSTRTILSNACYRAFLFFGEKKWRKVICKQMTFKKRTSKAPPKLNATGIEDENTLEVEGGVDCVGLKQNSTANEFYAHGLCLSIKVY